MELPQAANGRFVVLGWLRSVPGAHELRKKLVIVDEALAQEY